MTIKDIIEKMESHTHWRDNKDNLLSKALQKHLEDYQEKLINHIIEMIDRNKLTVPKNPLDMTVREQTQQSVQPVYREYISNEESVNQALDTLKQKLLQEQGESKI